jgi:magnesium-transporting ATPase (P-type)
MAAIKVSSDDDLTTSLFPGGLPDSTAVSDKELRDVILQARDEAGTLHRSEFEGFENDGTTKTPPSFELVGFACFDAAVRPSTRRIIQELKAAQVNVIMLTGDGVDAAISVADTAGLLLCDDSIAILDLEESPTNDMKLVWKMLSKKSYRKKKSSSFEIEDSMSVTEESIKIVLEDAKKGRCSLVITGKAAEILLSPGHPSNGKAYSQLCENLFRFTIFARASPKQKRAVVSNLKDHCGMKVLMCGMSLTFLSCVHRLLICYHFLIHACLL